jgi:hypothetical protein
LSFGLASKQVSHAEHVAIEVDGARQVKPPTKAAGLARRATDKSDLRVVRIRATAKGRKLLVEGRARRLHQLTQMLEAATAPERAAITAAVSTLQRLLKQSS